eukprot:652247-Alexandrium_andersonii.AAC.1
MLYAGPATLAPSVPLLHDHQPEHERCVQGYCVQLPLLVFGEVPAQGPHEPPLPPEHMAWQDGWKGDLATWVYSDAE